MTEFTLHCPAFATDRIAEAYALGQPDKTTHVAWGGNMNPALSWEGMPAQTVSLVLICCDPDAPSVADQVNQEGQVVPKDFPRVPFYHWLLWNIPVSVDAIPEGALSQGVTARGKAVGSTPYGEQGANDYTDWFKGDADMEGVYGGYDGPCPPWNDERVHRYALTLYALDTRLDLPAEARSGQLLDVMAGHVLAKSSVIGRYSLNSAHN